MAAVSEAIVREYFEAHEFLVRQYRKYVAPAERQDDEIDFLVVNPNPKSRGTDLPFVLGSADLAGIARGIVVLKAWHSHSFTPALLTNEPELFRFLEKKTFQQAVQAFGAGEPPLKVLVVPALPHDTQTREQSVAILRAKGIDAAISFRTMLADLVAKIEPNRNYQKSDLLQTLRILKNYNFLKEPQLELFKARRRKSKV